MDYKINREIRAKQVRVIDQDANQVGVLSIEDALSLADKANLDLVEMAPNANPPVCRICDHDKFRYEQTKKEKKQKVVKLKEVKLKPGTSEHDIEFKLKNAREFIAKGNKVKLTLTFRGREQAHPEIGERSMMKMIEGLEDVATPEAPMKLIGRTITTVVAPGTKKAKPQQAASAPSAEPKA